MLLLPTLNPPSARRTLRGADFRGISRYITIIIRSIILGDEKRRRGRAAKGPAKIAPLDLLSSRRLSRGKLAWLRLGSTQPIFDNSRSLHRDLYPHARIILRTYVFDLIAGSCRSKLITIRQNRRAESSSLSNVLQITRRERYLICLTHARVNYR